MGGECGGARKSLRGRIIAGMAPIIHPRASGAGGHDYKPCYESGTHVQPGASRRVLCKRQMEKTGETKLEDAL